MKTIKSTFYLIFFTILLIVSCSKETSTTPTVEEPQQEIPALEFNTLTTPIDKTLEVKLLPVPILEWNVKNALEGEIIKYSIRLGTSENNLETIATDYTETDFQIDFLLDPETTYFWQIVLTNRDKGETLSPIYRFTSDTIKIEDPVIEQIVRDALLKPEGKFTREELESITSLPLDETIPFYDAMEPYGLPETLTGLEYCTNLHYINFYGKGFKVPLSNIKALSNLKDITYLNLANNQITEVQSIGGLTELTYLHLGWNTGINDISYLTNLKKLKTLNLTYTYGLRDLTPLASLPQLDS
ncbi:leucine-rich repeat domain-containing protein [Maribacter sp. IgM3_T14_3]|uniref:leucine-rich repeat domain-containing protein n=1 Tax=Maribacter sp. IgM3_T14_3 TaxID=3415140 RepID=UPI003C703A65